MAKIKADLDSLQLDVAPLCSAEIKGMLLIYCSHMISLDLSCSHMICE